MNGHKLYEFTVNERGIRLRHANPNPMSANQKFGIVMSLIGVAAFLGFFWMMTR